MDNLKLNLNRNEKAVQIDELKRRNQNNLIEALSYTSYTRRHSFHALHPLQKFTRDSIIIIYNDVYSNKL